MSKFSFLTQNDFISPCLPIHFPLPSLPLPGSQKGSPLPLNTSGSCLLTLPRWAFCLFFWSEVISFPFLFRSCSEPKPRLQVLQVASERSKLCSLLLTELHRPKVHKVFPTSHRTPHREEAAGVSLLITSLFRCHVTLQGKTHLHTRNVTDVVSAILSSQRTQRMP